MILRAVSLSLVGLLMGAAACDARAGGGAATTRPGEGAGPVAPEGNEEGDSPEELELRLERLVNEQADQMKLAASDSAACEELCSLATSICGVQEKLCVIADERPSEERYQGLCRQAKRRCSQAQEACMQCVEGQAPTNQSAAASTQEDQGEDEDVAPAASEESASSAPAEDPGH